MYPGLTNIESHLRLVAEKHGEIVALFLFGSVLTCEKPGDLDIAVLIDEKQVPVVDIRYHLSLMSDFYAALERDDIDLVVLNRASSVIAMQVLRKGKKVFIRNERLLNDFIVRTGGMYHDLKIIRRPIERGILRGRIYA